ncbi:MAG: Uma2 family endonuclease [Roseofilum sp. SBFL]|uniref:Uma2 family endonuclease n=1 Tax=unclassified Roseofilum TaxID=2620099 RepID=UPI001B068BCC|nr:MULTISPECIES: Uma2 family endonuclease [unclassified Roseofilum]MBP0011982.1 Uma2 family endonuclease [Roseofilum sp. SID3]MBP0022983.1 Uma2 family endonuclease [Roseofilum sp. SID2]MBP0037480.1 Uma2 family endonuclease [Roseofilum sp. SID1]MBP0044731.1 Uma2 family endonuclease [Roseofilum sp. SBFL]
MTQGTARVVPRLTPQDYLEWEVQQPLRYEYFNGEVFAMAGGTLPHADIALNLASLLREPLRGRCKVRNSDAKVGITDEGPFTYPDISISCDERDRTARHFIRYPCVIIEVLSPSTEAYDRGGKFALYRRLSTLQEYVLVSSETKTVEIFRRDAVGEWRFIPYSEGDTIELMSLGITLSLNAIYEDVVVELEDEGGKASL